MDAAEAAVWAHHTRREQGLGKRPALGKIEMHTKIKGLVLVVERMAKMPARQPTLDALLLDDLPFLECMGSLRCIGEHRTAGKEAMPNCLENTGTDGRGHPEIVRMQGNLHSSPIHYGFRAIELGRPSNSFKVPSGSHFRFWNGL